MLIDAHNHPNWHGHDAQKILENMDQPEIDITWLFSWEVPEDEYSPSYHKVLPPGGLGIPLEDVLLVGRQAPDRFVRAASCLIDRRFDSWRGSHRRTRGTAHTPPCRSTRRYSDRAAVLLCARIQPPRVHIGSQSSTNTVASSTRPSRIPPSRITDATRS